MYGRREDAQDVIVGSAPAVAGRVRNGEKLSRGNDEISPSRLTTILFNGAGGESVCPKDESLGCGMKD